jgi:uncharacterized protein
MKNNLDKDMSPYLQQHKDNPVHWQSWSKETLDLAKKKRKPILLSIGYASCHWCHVMAHESFEDKETAEIMNKYFINIKVDREERPDIDFIFQSAYQLFNQTGGGWPLTMFLDENAIPFMGGTYFPKIEKSGLPSFINIMKKIHEIYLKQREEINKNAYLISKHLEIKKSSVLSQDLEIILETILNNLDEKKGGYKGAPKFPVFNVYDTLLYFYKKDKNKKYIKPVELVLKQLCSQGIYDHVEGGIARYTVDEDWLIPHFEKMLYDNAQFILLLSNYVKIHPNKYFENKITQTINFIHQNFITEAGGLLGSAYDADSEGEEGKYYIFSNEELKKVSGVEKYFEIKPGGNWEGKNILKEIESAPNEIIEKLKEIRKLKAKPFFDNKIQLDLNSLWISSLIAAHSVLPDQNYLKKAERLYSIIETKYAKTLFHSNNKSIAFLEDYAYLICTLIDLSEATLNSKYIIRAKELCQETITEFYLKDKQIFQKNKKGFNDIFHNPIDISDNTIPNGNSIMLINLSRLGFEKESQELANSLNGYLNIYKSLMTSSIKSIDFFNVKKSKNICTDQGCS